jgi:hypothetical protein
MAYAEALPAHLRLRIYPQPPYGGGSPRLETVILSPRAGSVGPGPSDRRMYTVDAPGKQPYGPGGRPPMPPWRGLSRRPVMPSTHGQFDYLGPTDPGFRQVHLYGCVRFALDVWQRYLGRPIDWHFRRHFDRLELVTLGVWPNAHMGYGFLEVGKKRLGNGTTADYALNFDVIGHEVGHALMMSFANSFAPNLVTPDYEALHEASADWAAMIAALHFDTVMEELLETTRGDLYTANALNRFAELSNTRQIRRANNNRTMWDFVQGWSTEHETAEPIIGGLFDAFVEIYKELLVLRGVIPRELDSLAQLSRSRRSLRGPVRLGFERAYADHPDAFFDALGEARTTAAVLLVSLWTQIDPLRFRLADLIPIFRAIDLRQFDGTLLPIVLGSLIRRGIGTVSLGPRLDPPGAESHLHSSRTMRPG